MFFVSFVYILFVVYSQFIQIKINNQVKSWWQVCLARVFESNTFSCSSIKVPFHYPFPFSHLTIYNFSFSPLVSITDNPGQQPATIINEMFSFSRLRSQCNFFLKKQLKNRLINLNICSFHSFTSCFVRYSLIYIPFSMATQYYLLFPTIQHHFQCLFCILIRNK